MDFRDFLVFDFLVNVGVFFIFNFDEERLGFVFFFLMAGVYFFVRLVFGERFWELYLLIFVVFFGNIENSGLVWLVIGI